SHTPYDHCVRFAMVVTFHSATLVTRRALPLTRTGLSPAGSRQLRLAHRYSFTVVDSHHLLLAGLPAHSLTLVVRMLTCPGSCPELLTRRSPPQLSYCSSSGWFGTCS
ncbi:MAG: hypothetical protein ACREFO_14095, partial [Acetobacteraceae bacterium]